MCAFAVHPDKFGVFLWRPGECTAWQKEGVAGGGVNVRQLVSTELLPMQKLASIQKRLETKSPFKRSCQSEVIVSQM